MSFRHVSPLRYNTRPFITSLPAAVILTLLHSAVAHSQNADPGAPADANGPQPIGEEKVIITGYRYSIDTSLVQKRNADAIVDVVTAEDIGKFPDKNVADALQRVPGVIITRSAGEGRNVSVRGLSPELTLTELNGNYIATAESSGDPTRSFNYTLLPANMLSSAELFKTPEARLDEGGIGGTVILHMRRPLDVKANSGFISAEGTRADTTSKTDSQFSGQYAWHDAASRYGILIGFARQKRTARTLGASTEDWEWYADDPNGHPPADVNGRPFGLNASLGQSGFHDQNGQYYANVAMPTSVNLNIRAEERERKAGQLTAQFKPIRNLLLTGNYFRFALGQDSQTNTLKIPEWNLALSSGDGNWPGGRMLDHLSFDKSHTIVTGAQYSAHPGKSYYCSEHEAVAAGLTNAGGFGPDDCTIPTPQITGSYNRQRALSQTADLEAEWQGESLDARFKVGRTWADGDPSLQFTMPIKPRVQNADGSWTLGNHASAWSTAGRPSMTFSPELMTNLQNGIGEIDLGSIGSTWTRNATQQRYVQADFTWHTDGHWLESLQFGAKYRNGGTQRSTGNNYWVCQGADPADYGKRYQEGCDPLANRFEPQFLYAQSLGHLAGGINASAFPAIDYPAYLAYLTKTYGQMQTRNEDDFVYNVNEKIASAYLQTNIKTDRLHGNVGVRLVRTSQHASSTDHVDYFNDYFFDGPDGKPAQCRAKGLAGRRGASRLRLCQRLHATAVQYCPQ
jgi:TonB-dependent receptor